MASFFDTFFEDASVDFFDDFFETEVASSAPVWTIDFGATYDNELTAELECTTTTATLECTETTTPDFDITELTIGAVEQFAGVGSGIIGSTFRVG